MAANVARTTAKIPAPAKPKVLPPARTFAKPRLIAPRLVSHARKRSPVERFSLPTDFRRADTAHHWPSFVARQENLPRSDSLVSGARLLQVLSDLPPRHDAHHRPADLHPWSLIDPDTLQSEPREGSHGVRHATAVIQFAQLPTDQLIAPPVFGLHRPLGKPVTTHSLKRVNATNFTSTGAPLSVAVRNSLARTFAVDLAPIRVHTGAGAQRLVRTLSTRAFAYGNHIFLGPGEQPTDLRLIAHEVAHVVQQSGGVTFQHFTSGSGDVFEHEAERASAAAVRGESFTVQQRTTPRAQGLFGVSLDSILDGLAELAANLPGFTLLTVIIGRNPINLRPVERNFTNLLRGFMGLIPGGEILFQVLDRQGVVARLGNWVSEETEALGLNYEYLRGRFSDFIDSLSLSDILSPGDVWTRAQNVFTEPVNRLRSFTSRLIDQAITWLKETFMQPLANFCREIPGYRLVTVLLGRDPFTNAPVDRSALNVVRAFAEFIPGGTEKVNQLVESRALQRAYEWFIQETQARNLTWARVTGTFAAAWSSLRLEDVLHPIDTLRRMIDLFRPLLTDLAGFARAALMKLLELIFEAAMGAGGSRVIAIFRRARATFNTIIQNPVGFLRNLLGAVGQGVRQFSRNILTHLRQGVIAWLTGPVARAGIQMPEQWDLRGVLWFVLQILGLTWDRVRQKLVTLMGERVVAALETGFQLIQEIRERGLVQALRDRVTEFFGQLREQALGSIRSFIQERMVGAAITQLVSLLSPVGAVIQAIIKTYTTVKFFIDRINQILDLVESVVNSIAAIAAGTIGPAANFIESTMARTIPVILDFFARFIGLGDVGGHVQRVIQGLQQRVDQMLDRAVEWIRTMAQRLMQRLSGGSPEERLTQALTAAQSAVNRFARRRVGAVILRPLIEVIRVRYQLQTLESVPRGTHWVVRGVVNPTGERPTDAEVEGGTAPEVSVSFRAGHEQHRLWIETTSDRVSLMVASDGGQRLRELLTSLESDPNIPAAVKTNAGPLMIEVRDAITQVEAAPGADQQLRLVTVLSDRMGRFFRLFGEVPRLIAAAIRLARTGRGISRERRRQWDRWMAERRRRNYVGSEAQNMNFAATADNFVTISGGFSDQVISRLFNNPDEIELLNEPAQQGIRAILLAQQGVPGRSNIHAETKMSELARDQPFGVTAQMCPECQSFFTELAIRRQVVQVVNDGGAEPRIFLPENAARE
ncbi:MAG TPA: DUF4157 domain-containing protein [Pyrinomonadaceae bacterium]|nr:DUF4157 domain-containing protein [Pyrinomonadaceae bacterium]